MEKISGGARAVLLIVGLSLMKLLHPFVSALILGSIERPAPPSKALLVAVASGMAAVGLMSLPTWIYLRWKERQSRPVDAIAADADLEAPERPPGFLARARAPLGSNSRVAVLCAAAILAIVAIVEAWSVLSQGRARILVRSSPPQSNAEGALARLRAACREEKTYFERGPSPPNIADYCSEAGRKMNQLPSWSKKEATRPLIEECRQESREYREEFDKFQEAQRDWDGEPAKRANEISAALSDLFLEAEVRPSDPPKSKTGEYYHFDWRVALSKDLRAALTAMHESCEFTQVGLHLSVKDRDGYELLSSDREVELPFQYGAFVGGFSSPRKSGLREAVGFDVQFDLPQLRQLPSFE